MRPASDMLRDAVRESHRLATQATVNDTQVTVIDGTVTLDSSAAIRGRCDVTIVDDGSLGLVPDNPSSLLAPYGNEITLARGVIYPDGTSELVTLGVFGIQSVEVNDTPAGMEMRVSGLDRAARIVIARFEQPYQIDAGTNYADAILATLQGAWPDIPTSFATTSLVTPQLIAQEGDDRWAFCQQMAAAISMSLYFDGDGVCVLAPTTQTETSEMLVEGDHGVLLETGRNWTREGTYNRVIATGENTGESMPVRGIATDEDPASPTYYYGPFGRAPVFYASPFITTSAQAAAAAADRLQSELGTTEQVNFGSLVLPYLEPDDVLRIARLRAGIDETHVLTSLTIPLAATASMTGQTRAQRVVTTDSGDGGGVEWETFGIVDLSDGVVITAQDDTDFSGAWPIVPLATGPSLQITVKLDPPTDDDKTNIYLHVHDARTEIPPVAFGYFRFFLDMVNDDLVCDYDAYHDDGYHEVERVPYDSANHAWLRFTVAADTLHYEASPDGSAWTELASTAWPDDTAHTTPEGIIELNTASDIPSGPYDAQVRWVYLNINGTVILDAR